MNFKRPGCDVTAAKQSAPSAPPPPLAHSPLQSLDVRFTFRLAYTYTAHQIHACTYTQRSAACPAAIGSSFLLAASGGAGSRFGCLPRSARLGVDEVAFRRVALEEELESGESEDGCDNVAVGGGGRGG